MKKHRPKVVVDWKLKKASNPPKTPKTPKAPKTPKTPKAPKTPKMPKQKPGKRKLNFDLADTPDREFNLDDVKSEHTTPRRSGRKRNNLFANNFAFDTKIIQEPYVYTPMKIAEPCVYKPIKNSESIKDHAVTNHKGHSENSLKVYFRRYRCEKNSRKIGPNFPGICKKQRMRRQKREVIETLLGDMQTNRKQFLLPLSQDLGILRHEMDNSVTKCGKKIPKVFGIKKSKVFTPRQSLYLPVQNTMESTDIEDCVPAHQRVSFFDGSSGDLFVDRLMECKEFEAFHIRDESKKQLVIGDQNAHGPLMKSNPPKRHEKTRDKCNRQLVGRDQNANGGLVKYDPPKKRKKSKEDKPTVELDHETLRISRFLQDNEGSDPFKEMDEDPEYWEKERLLFTERICSFLQHTHNLLGNRCFSRWKGSVLDSIVGVYLTQNVNDVLSSSTFMKLAAKFPPKTTNNNREPGDFEEIICSMESVDSNKLADEQPHDEMGAQPEISNQYKIPDQISDHMSDAIPGEISRGCTGDGYAADHHEKNCNNSFDLNDPFWDHLKNFKGNSVAKKKHQHDAPLGKNGKVEGKKAETIPMKVEGKKAETVPMKVKDKKAETIPKIKKTKVEENWDELRKKYSRCRESASARNIVNMDSVNWEAVRCSKVQVIAETIKDRGMNNRLAKRIKDFLDRVYKEHGSLDLEWLRDFPPDKAKKYLLSIFGIGLKSTECIRLLCLHQIAFPVDTNVARLAVRLGWVPLQSLPESIDNISQLNAYPGMDSVQEYLWPRLRTLLRKDLHPKEKLHSLLYQLHYHMITFGKVMCTKQKPNCKACPMKAECKHYASIPRTDGSKPEEKLEAAEVVPTPKVLVANQNPSVITPTQNLSLQENNNYRVDFPISPKNSPVHEDDTEAAPSPIHSQLHEDDTEAETNALMALVPSVPKDRCNYSKENSLSIWGNINSLTEVVSVRDTEEQKKKKKEEETKRAVHQVYELPDSHPLLNLYGFAKRLPIDPNPYLLAIWASATTEAVEAERCNESLYPSSCSSIQEYHQESAWGSILIPCRTATREYFPLNGTYFQVNEVFADFDSSRRPIRVPRKFFCYLKTRNLYCGHGTTFITRELSADTIADCFWEGFICVREFDRKTRIPYKLDSNSKWLVSEKPSVALGKRKGREEKKKTTKQ